MCVEVLLKQEVIGQHVRRLRRGAGLTTRALGTRTDFSASFISQLENGLGKHPYGHETAEDYAFVLRGPVRLSLGPDLHVLRTGDAVCFQPGELRLWENPASRAAALLFVSVRR